MTFLRSPRFPPLAALALCALALPLVATALPAPTHAAEGPSVWRDGAWLPLDATAAADADGPAAAGAALRSAAAAATVSEGSQIQQLFPLVRTDGTVQVAVFAAVVGGESCLWRTDGTAAGTFRVQPAGGCVALRPDSPFVGAADGVGYFVAGHSAYRLWRTDGTAAGTWPLVPFGDPGLWNRRFDFIAAPPLGGVLFVLDDGFHGPEPWFSDGTPSGARLLADLTPGPDGTVAFRFQALGSDVLFFVWRGGPEYELWRTDGSEAGTELVATVASEDFPLGPGFLYRVDAGVVFFLAGAGPCWAELWRSDGTAAGTQLLRDFAGPSCPSTGRLQAFAVAGFPGSVFFASDDGIRGAELWRTDGTPSGTFAVTDFAPAQPFPSQFPLLFRPAGHAGHLYFAADDGVHGREPWRSDGTPGGSELVADLCPGSCSSAPGPMSVAGGWLVFTADDQVAGRELWVSDGTAAGSERVTDLCPGACGASIFREVVFGASLLFILDDATSGQEWWILTPPAGPAIRLTDLAPPRPFDPLLLVQPLGGRAVFVADDGVHGREPWVTDGTPAGTHLLADLEATAVPPPPGAPAAPANLHVEALGGGHLRFTWEDRSHDEQFFLLEVRIAGSADWQSAGTAGADATSLEGFFGLGSLTFRLRAGNAGVLSAPSNEVSVTVGGFCHPSEHELCLGDGRFRVVVNWRNQHAPPGEVNTGSGQAVPAGDGVDDSGYFWFFTPDNLELVVKVLDGTSVNGHFWVFWGALSDVEYTIHVEDTASSETRDYHNPPGQICGGADTAAFPLDGSAAGSRLAAGATVQPAPATAPAAASSFAVAHGPATRFVALDAPASASGALHPPQPCVPDEETLCLLDGTLAVTVDWTDQHNGGSGVGRAIPYTDISGFFWFFHRENIELVVKALDGRTVNGKIWVFYGALSDVGYTIRVLHDEAHQVRTYENPPGTICGQGDTAAF
jgi:ELWxxDGT repeat protein